MNRLYYGDNLDVLRQHVKDDSVELVYLDPPFNSNRSYNVLFKSQSGQEAQAQIEAFDDTWHWSQQADELYKHLVGLLTRQALRSPTSSSPIRNQWHGDWNYTISMIARRISESPTK
jgi:adenine specific DNA methylase Mod